jgi:hypothetical protein
VRRFSLIAASLLALGCSDLVEGAGGVVELQIRVPEVTTVEVGETLQLTAIALDKEGNPAETPITWNTPDTTVTVDGTGLVTGVAPGVGQVQAFAGSLPSAAVPITVSIRADTLALVGDSVVTVAPGANSAPLVVQLLSISQPDPLPSRTVIYSVSFPTITVGQVHLPNGTIVDTNSTGTSGVDQSITLNRDPVAPAPDTAFVQVRSPRASGVDVPGSGQRFIVVFQ